MDGAVRAARTWPVLALAGASAVVGLVGLGAFSAAVPYVGFPGLIRQGTPALTLAVAAAVAAVSGRRRAGSVLLVVAAVAAAAPGLSIGLQQRWSGWVAVGALGFLLAPAVVAVAVTFPDGGFPGRTGRIIGWAAFGAGATAVITESVTDDPAAWSWCRCLANPLAIGVKPAVYQQVADARTVVHAAVAMLGLTGFAALRLRRPPRGSGLAFAAVLGVLLTTWTITDVVELVSAQPEPSWLSALSDLALVLLPVLYVVGYAGRRPSRAHVADLLLAARQEHDPARLRALVARALGDPHAVVAWWDGASQEYRDHRGRTVAVPDHDVLAVDAAGGPVALVLSDRLDWVGPAVRDSLAEALRLAAENRHLTAELQATLDQVRESRVRILTASDDARRRIERDLHDGAQQLLISTGIKLNIAAARAAGAEGAPDLMTALDDASDHLNRALVELRQIAGGIAPTALVHGSLANALQELALRVPVPTAVRVIGGADPDETIASTVYFVVAECLTNVAKHAHATRAEVEVVLDDPVRLTVTDDGRGGAGLDAHGTGLRGLVDRVDARGGTLDLASDGSGTTVTVSLPLHATTQSRP